MFQDADRRIIKEWAGDDKIYSAVSITTKIDQSLIDRIETNQHKIIDEVDELSSFKQFNIPKDEYYEMAQANIDKLRAKDEIQFYSGFCYFTKKPVIAQGVDNIMLFVPVYGGIQFAEPDLSGGLAVGFDTFDIEFLFGEKKFTDEDIIEECESMGISIEVAAEYELDFLMAESLEDKFEVVQKYYNVLENDFGVITENRTSADCLIAIWKDTLINNEGGKFDAPKDPFGK